MFAQTAQPLPLSEACLQCLCASLNAPVVRVDGLPAGPARAALVVYAEQYGDLGVAVGIRSLEGGEVVLMRNREPLPPEDGPDRALEAATSFAEALGFVFDQDMIGTSGSLEAKTAALEHWQHLMASDEVFEAPDVASPPAPGGVKNDLDPEEMPEMEDLLSASASQQGAAEPVAIELDDLSLGDVGPDDLETGSKSSELLLDELAPLEIDDGVIDDGARVNAEALEASPPESEATEAARPALRAGQAEVTEPIVEATAPTDDAPAEAAARPAFSPGRLSKFRRPEEEGIAAPDAPAGDEAPKGGSALGRIKIVRKKKNEDGRATARSRIHASY